MLVAGHHELRQVVARQSHRPVVESTRGDAQRHVVHLLRREALRQFVEAYEVVQAGDYLAQFLLQDDVRAFERLAVDGQRRADEREQFQYGRLARAAAGQVLAPRAVVGDVQELLAVGRALAYQCRADGVEHGDEIHVLHLLLGLRQFPGLLLLPENPTRII